MPTKKDTQCAEIMVIGIIILVIYITGSTIHYNYLVKEQDRDRIKVVETYKLNEQVSPSVYYTTQFMEHSRNIELAQEFKNFIIKYNSPPNNFNHIQYDTYDMHVLTLDNGYELQCIVNYKAHHSKGVFWTQKYTWVEITPKKEDLK